MDYQFHYKTKVSDLWQLSMYYAYSSFLAVINIVCIVSSIALLVKFYATANWFFGSMMLLFALLFTFIQPTLVYQRAKNQLKGHEQEITLSFSDKGMLIECEGKKQTKHYNELSFIKKPTLIAIYVGKKEGYILTNKVLGKDRNDFIKYLLGKITK